MSPHAATTLIKNGTLVTASDTYQADLLVSGERIVRIAESASAGSAGSLGGEPLGADVRRA